MDLFERLPERLLAWLPLATHPPLSQLLAVVLVVVTCLVIVVLFRLRRRGGRHPDNIWTDGIEKQITVRAQPLMNGSEVAVFNLLLMAVRDHFLLLSKVPLRNLLQLRVDDASSKRAVAQALRNVTVDFVLVHPGTRLPVKVVFLEKPDDDVLVSPAQGWLVEALFLKVGIEVIWLDQDIRYSMEQLTNLLGLQEET